MKEMRLLYAAENKQKIWWPLEADQRKSSHPLLRSLGEYAKSSCCQYGDGSHINQLVN